MEKTLETILQDINNVGLVYLSGSHLTNTNGENSDYDYYVFVLPSKKQFMTKQMNKGHDFKINGSDVHVLYMSHFYQLLKKSNPSIMELLVKKPVYASQKCQEFADYLYNNRNSLISSLNPTGFLLACMGMKDNMLKQAGHIAISGRGDFGKAMFNANRAYRYAKGFIDNEPLDSMVLLHGEALQAIRAIKNMGIPELDTAKLVIDKATRQGREIDDYLADHFFTSDETSLVNDMIISKLPLYQEAQA